MVGAAFGGTTASFLGLRGPFIIFAIVVMACALFGKPLLNPIPLTVTHKRQPFASLPDLRRPPELIYMLFLHTKSFMG
jgi:hypothetical protein